MPSPWNAAIDRACPAADIKPTNHHTGRRLAAPAYQHYTLPAPHATECGHKGEVSERLMELVSKTSVRFFPYRGFESPPLRFSSPIIW